MISDMIFLYGPPGSGKSAVGRQLAQNLGMPFVDLDEEIVKNQNRSVQQIFSETGETRFREIEKKLLQSVTCGVVSLGGGTLLDPENRDWAEQRGSILMLSAPLPDLMERLHGSTIRRPLLEGSLEDNLSRLLDQRADHYASFENRVNTGGLSVEACSWEAQIALGLFQVSSMGNYPVRILEDGLRAVVNFLPPEITYGKVALISDETVSALYGSRVTASFRSRNIEVSLIEIPVGEQYKTIETVTGIWNRLLDKGIGRDDLILSLGGGVVSDLAGFAAATYLRGVRWAVLPTTLLAMVDASLGGKTGIDLARGKNLAGAFYPPVCVIADPLALDTLPQREWRSGLAEVVKHAVIADPLLFDLLGSIASHPYADLDPNVTAEILRRAAAVKVRIIERDPYEKGEREALNLGHTIGHAVEQASGYQILHGEAVSIGMVIEARLAEEIGLAQAGLSDALAGLLSRLGLPVAIPKHLEIEHITLAMQVDKKKKKGKIRFSLPVRIGEVQTGIEIENLWRQDVFRTGAAWTEPELTGNA